MEAKKNFAILLNSCDSYSDLWHTFFDQLFLNLKIDNLKVYINSETKSYVDDRFIIVNHHKDFSSLSWSSRLREVVSSVKEDFILSIPEEVILESPVDLSVFYDALRLLSSDKFVASVCLVKIPGKKDYSKVSTKFVKRVYDYRNLIVQQASIWRKSFYLDYIKPNESPWEFEVLSSARGVINQHKFFAVDDNEKEVFDYNYGHLVTRGYFMFEEVKRLECKLNLTFDYSAREAKSQLELEKLKNPLSMFYWRLRAKKYWILLFKLIKNSSILKS